MNKKLIALIASATFVVGIPAAVAVASPDANSGSKDSSSKLEQKAGESRDRSVDTNRGTRDDSKADRKQDDRKADASLGERSSNEGTSSEASAWDDSSNDNAQKRDKDSSHKEGSRTDHRTDKDRHVEERAS